MNKANFLIRFFRCCYTLFALLLLQHTAWSNPPLIQDNSSFLNQLKAYEKEHILTQAEKYWNADPQSVTDWTCERSAGTPNDFYSEGDYWWPDPNNPDGPYVRRDGFSNPDNFSKHREAMIRMAKITGTMASAYILTGEDKYAEQAMKHFRAWFIDASTRMNPDLLYSQAIKGRYTGRSIGVIDGLHLIEPALAIKAIAGSDVVADEELSAMKSWFSDLVNWLYIHEFGMEEMIHPNNHGTCWTLQVAAFADLTQNDDMLALCDYRFSKQLLPKQMHKNGSFPLELERTKPYGYSIFNLDAMSSLAQILQNNGFSAFTCKAEDGQSLKTGMEFLFPYIEKKENWPYQKDVLHYDDYPVQQAFLLFGAQAYNKEQYFEVWKGLERDPENKEVVRNTIVKNPLLWFNKSEIRKHQSLTLETTEKGEKMLQVPDGLWGNKGSISFEFKLSEASRKGGTQLVDCPILNLVLRGKFLWPDLKEAPTPKGERRERVQFAFLNNEQWYHMSIAWDGRNNELQFYLNGDPQQRVIYYAWTRDDFSGPLLLGNKDVAIRNVEMLGGFINDKIAEKLVRGSDLTPLSGEGRITYEGELDLKDYKKELVYESDFTEPAKILHEQDLFENGSRQKLPEDAVWVIEGNASAEIKDGSMIVTNSLEGNPVANHAVLWNTEVFPENFLLEFEMTPRDPGDGLAIIFFCATARESGGSVFSTELPMRDGVFGNYNSGAINCYHTSYWASSKGESRLTTNLRKNHGFDLVSLGDEKIAATVMDTTSNEKGPFPVRLAKIGNQIQVETMGQLVLKWEDDGRQYGPVLGAGQIGLRQMGHAGQVKYHSIRVYALSK